jgi:bromodomain-containing protein 7
MRRADSLCDVVEDPFSVLSALIPDPSCAAPLVTPLFPPPPPQPDASPQITLPLPINVPAPTKVPTAATTSAAPVSQSTPAESTKSKYRHWTVTRPAPQRGKAKDPAIEERPPTPEWRKPRPLHAADYGLFPSLATTDPSSPGGKTEVLATQERLFGALYASLENPAAESSSSSTNNEGGTATATVAQSWLREIVYGGWDGLAYMRSVAEFVTPHANPDLNTDAKEEDASDRGILNANATLAGYVDAVLVDELTEGRHRTVEAALTGQQQNGATAEPPALPPTQLDLGSLISAPNELFDAENAWVGAGANEDSAVLARALDHATHLLEQLQQQHVQSTRTGAGAEGMDVDLEPEERESTGSKERQDLETELRMNLIALAKRAPLDQIARMPSELVPPHLRHVVPTIGY